MRSGVVVAGGRSTRFGAPDKAVADLGGTPMIRRVADRIAPAVEELVVNCRPAQTAAIQNAMAGYSLPVSYAEDDVPDRGPVAGIRNGLAAAAGGYAFVVACDMPFVDPALASYLFECARSREAAVPRLDGWLQPTQAVYHVAAARRACTAALERGGPAVRDVLEDLAHVVVEASELADVTSPETFENVNTPEEFDAVRDRVE